MSRTAAPPDEFAATMQQLIAEAEKSAPGSLPPKPKERSKDSPLPSAGAEEPSVKARLDDLERVIAQKIDELAGSIKAEKPADLSVQFNKIEEQLDAIHSSETVNHRLFDSLHKELLTYRDNFLHESLQKPFIHDLVHLFDDLTSLSDQLQNAATQDARGHISNWRDNLENTIHSLVEILHRFEVMEIEPKEMVDRTIHRVVSYEPADYAEDDGRIVMRVRRGFFWRGKLIRPEEVIAKRFG